MSSDNEPATSAIPRISDKCSSKPGSAKYCLGLCSATQDGKALEKVLETSPTLAWYVEQAYGRDGTSAEASWTAADVSPRAEDSLAYSDGGEEEYEGDEPTWGEDTEGDAMGMSYRSGGASSKETPS